jgi:hypothetical protein
VGRADGEKVERAKILYCIVDRNCLKVAYGRKLERDATPRDGSSTKHRMAVFEKDFRDEVAVTWLSRGEWARSR